MAEGKEIAAALRRVESVLQRRPDTGLHDDPPATARWEGGLRVVSRHASGIGIATDMPAEMGGSGDHVTPGWLFRAGLAACSTTRIAMAAAAAGIALDRLELKASSRSDARGIFGMADADGHAVGAGPRDVTLTVRIAARGVAPERLRALVDASHRNSPVACAAEQPTPVALRIEVDSDD